MEKKMKKLKKEKKREKKKMKEKREEKKEERGWRISNWAFCIGWHYGSERVNERFFFLMLLPSHNDEKSGCDSYLSLQPLGKVTVYNAATSS